MKITNLVNRKVHSCAIHNNLEYAAQLMWDYDIGYLPVVDDQGCVAGVITDRDICMAAYTQGAPLRDIPVTTAMAKHVLVCGLADEVEIVERAMSKNQIRRMPVVDDRGCPIGILSLNDLARAASIGKVSSANIASVLAAVSAPRTAAASAA